MGEVVEEGGSRPDVSTIRHARESGWLTVIEPNNRDLVNLLKQELHAGEAESIVLAIETKPDILILDESDARRIAGLYDLPITEIIGLLMQGKKEGQIDSLRDEMDRLRNQGGFWIHDKLYERILDWEQSLD